MAEKDMITMSREEASRLHIIHQALNKNVLAKGVNELQIVRNVIFRRRTELSVQLERAAYNLSKAQADAQLL